MKIINLCMLFKIFTNIILFNFFLNYTIAQNNNIDNSFSIIILSDIHISNDETKDNRLSDIVSSINADQFENLELLVATGDNVSSFQKDRHAGKSISNQRGKRFYNIISKVNIPCLIALGNHDYKIDSDKDSDDPFSKSEIDTMEILWKETAGIEPFFSYAHKGWNMIVLNSMRGRYQERFFDDDQLEFLKKELQKDMPALLFFHHPIETDKFNDLNKPTDIISKQTEPDFYKIVEKHKDKIKGIFAGHIHIWHKDKLFETVPVYVTDSFADNELSPYHFVQVDTISHTIYVTQHEFIED